jgi:hypothetical protein
MRYLIITLLLFLSACSWKNFAPTIGAGAGAGLGAIGGIPGAVAGGTLGAGAGQIIKEIESSEKAKATLQALSENDIQKLVQSQLDPHFSLFDDFTETIKKILMLAGIVLLGYLTIPIWLAKKTARTCAKTETEKHITRAPFPK